jgi:hypothetical protein
MSPVNALTRVHGVISDAVVPVVRDLAVLLSRRISFQTTATAIRSRSYLAAP